MSGNAENTAAMLKNDGAKAKAGGAKMQAIATDPDVQAKVRKIVDEGNKIYRAVTSPEARRAYRHAAKVINKARKKLPGL